MSFPRGVCAGSGRQNDPGSEVGGAEVGHVVVDAGGGVRGIEERGEAVKKVLT